MLTYGIATVAAIIIIKVLVNRRNKWIKSCERAEFDTRIAGYGNDIDFMGM